MSAVVGTTRAAGIVGLSTFADNITAPTQIPGLLGWYDGLDPLGTGVVPSNGFSISNWIDKSGRSNNASNIGGSIPSYSNNAVYFNGSASNRLFFTNPNELVANKAFSIFAVEKRQGSATSSYFLAGTTALQMQNLHMGYRYGFEFAVAFYGDDQNITIPNYTTAATEPYRIWTTTLNNSSLGITFLNGTTLDSYQHGGLVTSYTGGGIGGTPTFPGWYTGFIQELIFFSNVVTATQQQQIEGYLAWKWGLAANLPVTSFQFNSNILGLSGTLPTGNANIYNAPFTNFITAPTQVPGLQLWLDGADSNQITLSGSNITQWRDKSGNANTFTPASGVPTYNTTEQAVSFVSSNSSNSDVMVSSSNIAFRSGSNTVFVVAKVPTNPFNYFQIIFNVGVGGDNSLRTNYNSPPNIYPNQGFTGTNNTLYYTGTPILNTGADTPSYSATTRFIVDSVYGLGNTTTQVTLSSAGFIGGGYRSLTGFIYEVLVYSNALTANQRTQVEGYLAWKWGLNSNLPAAHYQQNSNVTGMPAPIPASIVPKFTASSFLPSAYSGLALWLDAADATTITLSNGGVTQWRDKSGTGSNATQSNVGNSPTYTNNGVVFTASSSNFLNINIPFSTSHSVFLVTQSTSGTQNYYYSRSVTGAGPAIIQYFTGTSIEYFDIGERATFVTSPPTSSPFMVNFIRSFGNTVTGFYLGNSVFSIQQTYTSNTTQPWIYIGRSDLTNYLNATIFEFIIYNSALTSQQRQNVEGYLAWKWGLTRSLPGTHQNVYMPP